MKPSELGSMGADARGKDSGFRQIKKYWDSGAGGFNNIKTIKIYIIYVLCVCVCVCIKIQESRIP